MVATAPKNAHEALRQMRVHQFAQFYEELYRWGADSQRRATSLGRRHVVLYAELTREALASGVCGKTVHGTPIASTRSTI